MWDGGLSRNDGIVRNRENEPGWESGSFRGWEVCSLVRDGYQASSLLTTVQTSTMLPISANLRISSLRKQLHPLHYRRVPTGSRHRSLSTTSVSYTHLTLPTKRIV